MKIELTKEELDAIKYYLENDYEATNQLLVSDSKIDVALYFDAKVNYNKTKTEKEIQIIKTIFEIMQKVKPYINEAWAYSRGTNIFEIDRFKNEPYIDRFLSATTVKSKAENEYCSKWEEPAVMYINADKEVTYLDIDKLLGTANNEIIISPFTKVKDIKQLDEIVTGNSIRKIKNYSVSIENQELEEIPENERKAILKYILDDADSINDKLSEIIRLQNENTVNYENIRKLEQLLAKYDNEIEKKEIYKDYSESERQADLDDIERINKELDLLKENVSRVFDIIKEDNNYVTNWKRNIAVYLMAECKEIEKIYKEKQVQEEVKKQEEEEKKEEAELVDFKEKVSNECADNIKMVDELIKNIGELISSQQKYAKIASQIECSYSALNNSFEMKKQAEILKELIEKIENLKNKYIEENIENLDEKLQEISKVNIQTSTLINYLNNPRAPIAKSKINRFEEMIIIEENELKRNIFKNSLTIRGSAELIKLRDDLDLIREKTPLKKLIGLFTGRNKLDEFMILQIGIMENAIKSTLNKNVRLDYNYSIHKIIAEIRMFVRDNEEDELIEEDVYKLQKLEKNLRNTYKVDNAVVEEIISKKESKNLPVDTKVTKKDLIEIETYRFLNKYGYDNMENKTEEKKYHDTTANEITRIIEYINTSGILKEEK